MRSRQVCILALLATALSAVAAFAEDVARANVHVNVQVAARTSLKVSSELLQFDVTTPGAPATAAIDFSAGARTAAGSDIVLSVEPLHGIDGPGGAADVETAITVAGQGEGLLSGHVHPVKSTVVGRWNGSGLRTGRLVFTLRAQAAGNYAMPVRFVLSAP